MDQINLKWKGGMEYEATIGDYTLTVDGPAEHGGNGQGPTPKPLMLVALGGCTGMDIASLARKMRVEFSRIDIDVEAEKNEEPPVVYTSLRVIYRFGHPAPDDDIRAKTEKMVRLSQERYCGVSAMLARVAPLGWEIQINGETIARD